MRSDWMNFRADWKIMLGRTAEPSKTLPSEVGIWQWLITRLGWWRVPNFSTEYMKHTQTSAHLFHQWSNGECEKEALWDKKLKKIFCGGNPDKSFSHFLTDLVFVDCAGRKLWPLWLIDASVFYPLHSEQLKVPCRTFQHCSDFWEGY